jgi:hypothetical protein
MPGVTRRLCRLFQPGGSGKTKKSEVPGFWSLEIVSGECRRSSTGTAATAHPTETLCLTITSQYG